MTRAFQLVLQRAADRDGAASRCERLLADERQLAIDEGIAEPDRGARRVFVVGCST